MSSKRIRHTAKDRAQAELDKAQRMYDRAAKVHADLEAAAEGALRTKNDLYERLLHRKADPDLREDPKLPIGGE